jgi:hypothetical protein
MERLEIKGEPDKNGSLVKPPFAGGKKCILHPAKNPLE